MELRRKNNPILISSVILLLSLLAMGKKIDEDTISSPGFWLVTKTLEKGSCVENTDPPFESWPWEFGLHGDGSKCSLRTIDYLPENKSWCYFIHHRLDGPPWRCPPRRYEYAEEGSVLYDGGVPPMWLGHSASNVSKYSRRLSGRDEVRVPRSVASSFHLFYALLLLAAGFVILGVVITGDSRDVQLQNLPSDGVPVSSPAIFRSFYFYGAVTSGLGLVVFLVHFCIKKGL